MAPPPPPSRRRATVVTRRPRPGGGSTQPVALLVLLGLEEPVALTHAEEAPVGTRHADLVVGGFVGHLLRDLLRLLLLERRGHRHHRTLQLLGLLQLGLLRVTRLRLAVLAREDDELRLVLLEALRVDLERLGGAVPPPVVHRDADRPRLLPVDPSLLELGECEAAAGAQLVVVLDGGRVDGGPEQARGWARGDSSGLLLPGQAPPLLARSLVEPRLDVVLPQRLVEVLVGDLIVVTHHGAPSAVW